MDKPSKTAPATADGGRRKASLQVLERTFAILGCFSEARPEYTTTELAEAVSLPIATAHRILGVLLDHGWVARDPVTKRFRLGPQIVTLGDLARAGLDLRRAALPLLTRLAATTGETALLTVLDERPVRGLCVERVETSQPLRLSLEAGATIPLHAGASQKAILANMRDDAREAVLTGPLEEVCRNTVTDPAVLRIELDKIRRHGWACSFEENNLHAWGVAVPILDGNGEVVAALGLAAPDARLSVEITIDHVRRVAEAAAELAEALGLPPTAVDIGPEALEDMELEAQVLKFLAARAAV
ncbi:MAG: IclR family transcriptional regulator [Actinobacteria bacterium]|nr:IclR family transcriptional regulator [Actinomycetota bacterium]